MSHFSHPCMHKAVRAYANEMLILISIRLRFCMVIRIFHPRHNGQRPPTWKDFLSQILSITFIFLLNSGERASMFSAKQGHYVPFL